LPSEKQIPRQLLSVSPIPGSGVLPQIPKMSTIYNTGLAQSRRSMNAHNVATLRQVVDEMKLTVQIGARSVMAFRLSTASWFHHRLPSSANTRKEDGGKLMIESQSKITLKSGEVVDFTVVSGPDKKWRDRIETLFAHKGDPWRWQNRQFLEADLSFDRRYYILHRNKTPFAGMLISEFGGVGVLNHVWTKPEDRGEGASSSLMCHLMKGFEVRHGKMMILHTGYGSIAYTIYKKLGFDSIEPKSKYMHWYSDTEKAFYQDYFAESRTNIKPLSWTHWVAIQPLFQGDFGDVVRCTALGQLGRACTAAGFLSFLRDEQARQLSTGVR
jgi:hypothetical protein